MAEPHRLATVANAPRELARSNVVKAGIGLAVGLTVSVTPVAGAAVLTAALALVLFMRMRGHRWRRDLATAFAASFTVVICFLLPMKHLDVSVGPIAYEDLPLCELCVRLYKDYGIVCHVLDPPSRDERLSFSTPHPMSRREVLEELSRETNRPLYIGFCGTGATILFGAYPSFTYLGEQRPPDREEGAKAKTGQH
jgi:hypothetical protein